MIWRHSDGSSGSIPCTSRCGLICGQCGSSGLDRCQSTHNCYDIWLVVWNMNFNFPYLGNVIIPTDEHLFQDGFLTTNQGMMSLSQPIPSHPQNPTTPQTHQATLGGSFIRTYSDWAPKFRWEPRKRSLGLQHFISFYDFYPGYDINHSKLLIG